MPTGPKLVAALMFGMLAYFCSDLAGQLLPEGSRTNWLSPLNGLIGVVMGWRICGARAGDGLVASLGYGLTTVFAITFWAILIWAGYDMTKNSMRMRYDGPVEALQEMGVTMVEYARMVATGPDVIGSIVIGALVCAWVTEFFSRRWT
jgi:Flp pilus assembly pilin Flp